MIITLFAPEYTALIAFDQWRSSIKTRDMKDLGIRWWKPIHAFYADMGGITVKSSIIRPQHISKSDLVREVDGSTQYVIRAKDLHILVSKKVIQLPEITKEDIKARSKGDTLAQCITACQVVWFAIDKFARLAAHLPICLLELSTLAFIACSSMIAVFWWSKPLDIMTSSSLTIAPEKEAEFLNVYPKLDFAPNEQDLAEKVAPKEFWADLNSRQKTKAKHALWIGSIFNGIHIAAWHSAFPSLTEQMMWRVCSTVAWGSLLAFYAALFLGNEVLVLVVAIGIIAPVYMTARLYLVVECLLELRSLPAAVYSDVPWSQFLPHA